MKSKVEVRKRSHKKFFATLTLVTLVVAVGYAVVVGNANSSAKRAAPIDAGEKTFYKQNGVPGVDWQPFEQSYALGFINLGDAEQTRHCSLASSTVWQKKKTPFSNIDAYRKDICKFGGVKKKNVNYYIDYPGGAWFMGEKYDIREYIWSVKGSCVPSVNVSIVRSWYAGSIARGCDAITIREWHFYPPGTLGRYDDGTFKTPTEEELARAEYQVSAGAEHGFRGVMRLDDFDGNGEGYAIPVGNRGVWTTYNTQTAVKKGNGLSSIVDYTTYKWVGNAGSTNSSNLRTGMWVQFESTARDPNDASDKGAPLTLAYYTTGHRSSISSDKITIHYELTGDIPQTIIDAMNNLKDDLEKRKNNNAGSDECPDDDEEFFCEDDGDTTGSGSTGGGFFFGGSISDDDDDDDGYTIPTDPSAYVWKEGTVKQLEFTLYGLYDPYYYYQELIDLLPEGYTFDGWYNQASVCGHDNLKIDRNADSEIIYGAKTYYGCINKKTAPVTNPATCYSDL